MSKSKDETSNRIMWVFGGAAATALTMFFVNKHLNEREELRRLQMVQMAQAKSSS